MLNRGAYVLILAIVALIVGGLLALTRWEPFGPRAYETGSLPSRAGFDVVKRAAYGRDRLWILLNTGSLWTVVEDRPKAREEVLGDPIHDLCVRAGAPVVVTGARREAETWTIRTLADGSWSEIASVRTRGEALVGLHCGAEGVSLLTARRLVRVGARPAVVAVSYRTPRFGVSTFAETPDHLYVGHNAGEWGGGLRRIDKRNGQVEFLERNDSGDICGGPLNTDCDGVTGVAVVPWKPGCVMVSTARMRGRLIEACGQDVRRAFAGPCPREYGSFHIRRDGEPSCSEPYFDLIRRGEALVAVGPLGVLVMDAEGRIERSPVPRLRRYGPFAIRFGRDLIFVSRSLNRPEQRSDDNPILVPR